MHIDCSAPQAINYYSDIFKAPLEVFHALHL